VAAGDVAQLFDMRAGHFDRVFEQVPIEGVLRLGLFSNRLSWLRCSAPKPLGD
jgi:hypothetical protein